MVLYASHTCVDETITLSGIKIGKSLWESKVIVRCYEMSGKGHFYDRIGSNENEWLIGTKFAKEV